MPSHVTLADDTNLNTVNVSVVNGLVVENPASQLFNDTFGVAAFDTAKWQVLSGGGGSAPTAPGTNASTTLASGTTLNGYSALISQPQFPPTEPGYLIAVHRVNLQNPPPNGNYAAWGLLNIPGTPTFAAPVTDGAVFDIVSGVLFAATYAGGNRLVIANLSAVQPKDTAAHKYWVRFRGDIAYWMIDNEQVAVANYQTGASGPNNNTLSCGLIAVSGGGGSQITLIDNGSTVSDSAHTTFIQSDGVYGWRKQTISPQASSFSAQVNSEGQRATYRYTVSGFTPVATPTAFVVIQGSATKVVRIKRIYVSGVATAAGNMPLLGTRRSTAGTLGSAVLTAVTAMKHDTNDAAATAVVSTVGTANYTTLGTAAGQGLASRIGLAAVGTGVADSPALYDFATRNDKPIILRGASDFFTLEGAGAAVPAGGALDIEIETEEDTF